MVQPRLTFPHHQATPLRVHIRRNQAVESVHDVDITMVDTDGHVVLHCGDPERLVFPRSAMKPLQAIALVEALLADGRDMLSAQELALICASHNAEDIHVDAVNAMLFDMGLDHETLSCGAHWSLNQEVSIAQARRMTHPTKAHNNCSGKHTGMVKLAQLINAPINGYAALNHPVQQRILGVLEAMTGTDLMQYPHGVDGCGAPALSGPIGHWARGFALFADPSSLPERRQQAIALIRQGIAASPMMIAGTGRACSAVAETFGATITVKTGAEGVFAAAFNDLGLGMMLKARDGNKRAAEFALGVVIQALGYDGDDHLNPFFKPILRNWAGDLVGDIILDPEEGIFIQLDQAAS